MRNLAGFGLIVCVATFGSAARAAPPAQGSGELRSEARRAKTWRYTWTAINAGLTVGAFAAVPLVSREDRPDFVVSGVGSAVTTLCTWIWPLRVEAAADELDALPPADLAQRLRLRDESARDERERIRWPWHVANVGLATVGGAVIAFGYQHYLSGALTALAGSALGEVQLFTQPTGLLEERATGLRLVPRLSLSPRFGSGASSWLVGVAAQF